jgi:hypothetical protein
MPEAPNAENMIAAQRLYAQEYLRDGRSGLFVPEAFVRGIRHIGYKSNVEAISELIDNSIQAYAERIDLVFAFAEGGSTAKPTRIALVDDGHGMDPSMLSLALMWGGTHRENDRTGLGRFGYGLPCATVSIGRRFTIYSKIAAGEVFKVTLDLDLLETGGYRNSQSDIVIPPAQPSQLPAFVIDFIERTYPTGWSSGTVVVIEKLDRLDWTTATGLRRNLMRHFGVAYHKLLSAASIFVDGDRVRPIDPLFLSPECELYSLDEDRAAALEPIIIELDASRFAASPARIVLRYAWLPPSFGATDKSRDATGINANDRFPIIKQYHGLIFSRNGRIVDVQSRTPWTTFINNDRYIRVEIEFSASLDEAFGVTTAKQQVSVSPEMWDCLAAAGLPKAIEHLRSKVRFAKAERTACSSKSRDALPPRSAERSPESSPAGLTIVEICEAAKCEQTDVGLVAQSIPWKEHFAKGALDSLLSVLQRRMSGSEQKVSEQCNQLFQDWRNEFFSLKGLTNQDIHQFESLIAYFWAGVVKLETPMFPADDSCSGKR